MEDLDLYAAYFKNNTQYYLNKLEQYRNGQKYLFNVYAFLFGIFWFMYRKLYLESLIILAAILIESFLEGFVTGNLAPNTGKIIGYLINVGMAIIVGMLANVLYLRKAEREVNKAKKQNTGEDMIKQKLMQKGGVSYLFLTVAVVALVAIFCYFYNLNNK